MVVEIQLLVLADVQHLLITVSLVILVVVQSNVIAVVVLPSLRIMASLATEMIVEELEL